MALSFFKVVSNKYNNEKKRKPIRKLAPDELVRIEGETSVSGRKKFRVETFTVIMDKLDSCLLKRLEHYDEIDRKFVFLHILNR